MQATQTEEHGERRDDWADQTHRLRRMSDQQHPHQRPDDGINGREHAPARPFRRVRPGFASNYQPHGSSDSDRFWRGIFETLGAELDGVEDQRVDIDVAQASLKAFRAVDVPAPVVPEGLQDIVTNVSFSVSLGAIADAMDLQRLLTM